MDISQYYGGVNILVKMQLENAEDYFWQSTRINATKVGRAKTVIYLGCNVLRTIHLAAQFVKLVQAISEDVAVLGGPAFCCGFPHAVLGENSKTGDRQGAQAINLFEQLSPEQVILWCPTCPRQFQKKSGEHWHNGKYDVVSAPEFLARNLSRFPQIYPGKPRIVALHQHRHDQEDLRNTAAVKQILSQLEGIRVIEEGELKGFSYHCATNAEHPSEPFMQALDASVAEISVTADTVVSVYHSCHRAVFKSAQRCGISCVNYVDLVAERVGFQTPDRYGYFVELGDENKIWEEVANRFNPKEENTVRQVIREYLVNGAGAS